MSRMNELVIAITEELAGGESSPEEIASRWGIPLEWVLMLVLETTE